VAREENITKAAGILHITQPTLSRQLMQLEDELGVQLFKRGKSKIILTDEGMLLRRRAEEIIDLSEKTERELTRQEELIGEVYIGGGETNTMKLLADIMKRFHGQYPLVKFDLFSGNADDVKEKIDRGLIDIGLLTEPVDISKYDFVRLPQKDAWGVVMRKDDPLSEKEFVTADDLKGKDIMFSKRVIVQNELASWFGDNYDKLNIVATYNLIYNATLMVEAGMGYAVCLEKLVYDNIDNQVCYRLFQPRLETGTVLVWKKHQVFSPATTKFIEWIKNAFKA
ncbi:MAG: LysR family transcriptional regulator, partial [Coprobacillus sp.]